MPDEATGGDRPVTPPDLDLLSPANSFTGRDAHWCLVHAGSLPVARVRLPSPADVPALKAALARALATPVAARALVAALARHLLRGLPQGVPASMAGATRAAGLPDETDALPSLTLAICTRGRPLKVRRALAAVTRQAGPGVDVLVVDGSDGGDADASALPTTFPSVRFVSGTAGALDQARNRALAESRADVVAFTDDDTIVSPTYARQVRLAFADLPEAAVVCGLVEPLDLATPGAIAVEAHGGLGRGYERRLASRAALWRQDHDPALLAGALNPFLMLAPTMGSGASMAVRREASMDLGGFDTALDAGTAAAAGGDVEFLFRALMAGQAVAYDPAVWLHHEHRAARDAALKQAEHWGTGLGAYLTRTAAAYAEERWAIRLVRGLLLAHFGRRALEALLDRSIPRDMLARNARGFLRGAGRYRAAARHAPPPVAPRAPVVPRLPDYPVHLDLREPIRSLEVPPGTTAVFTTRLDGETLGTIRLPSVNGIVGRGRIGHAVVEHFGERLLGVPALRAGAALLEAVASQHDYR